ncbi:Ohr family peroxiredoxin [Sphingomonas sp. PR090111-T3T-6A]|uniref:Ohr family peroxiredoxin n=1 Tax=Sphingomonas sp. PR090111-T3T-6A TaxID=685778 RepID=UPI000362E655|nr:Ohr family peroxiredoxin [Sphingomonas sp. PR090111-T3T-6A]
MTKIDTVLFTGKTHTAASTPEGSAHIHESRLDLQLSTPGKGTQGDQSLTGIEAHPTAEKLFAGAWSACLISAIGLVAQQKKVTLPEDLALEIEVDLGMTKGAYFLQARITAILPGIAQDVAEAILHAADQICPYSKAVRGNIDVALNVVTA